MSKAADNQYLDERYAFLTPAPPITPTELRAILKNSGSPPAHEQADSILGAYVALLKPNILCGYGPQLPVVVSPVPVAKARSQAKKALRDLRNSLSKIVAHHEQALANEPTTSTLRTFLNTIRAFDAKSLSLDIETLQKQPYIWHQAAFDFHQVYREITNDTKVSCTEGRGGPSIRFLATLLHRLGYGIQEPGAICQEIKRRRPPGTRKHR